tara:strand:- start:44 stop:1156 length:1113 start_codon:yes stop_codon:yes gene_type:complete
MELELLETLPNGRKIYLRPKTNRSAVKQAAIEINNIWRKFGKKDLELKPLFQDQAGKFHEIEAGGEGFKNADNPKGYKFTNYVNHLKRNLLRSSRDKTAIVALSEVEEATRQVFPGLSKKDHKLFARALYDFNEQEIGRILASKKYDESTDHVRSLAKGGLNWFSNLLNIKTPLNLTKGAKDLPDASYKDINNPANRIEAIKASLSSDRIKGNPKYKANVLANAFQPKSQTAKNIRNASLGGTALSVLDLLIPGETSAKQFESAIHEGGSWSEAGKTYLSEKKGEFTATAKAAPFVLGATKLPFVGAAMGYAAPFTALLSVVAAADKADDIFLQGKTKEYLKEHEPGKHIEQGRHLTSIPGDYDYNRGKI